MIEIPEKALLLEKKCKNVILSCTTIEQLDVAQAYCDLITKNIKRICGGDYDRNLEYDDLVDFITAYTVMCIKLDFLIISRKHCLTRLNFFDSGLWAV